MSLLPTPVIADLEQLHAAFDAMHWPEWTFERALAFDLRRQLLVFHAGKVSSRAPQPAPQPTTPTKGYP